MKKQLSKNKIKNIIKESINNVIKESNLKKSLVESITSKVIEQINEDNSDQKRNAVMKSLKDNIYMHSQLAYKLYNCQSQKEKDTARSLFSKKFRQEPDDDGQIRQFDDEEVNKLYNMMRQRK